LDSASLLDNRRVDRDQPSRLLRSFERYLRAGNRSERTVGNYLESARQADTFLRRRGIRLEDATRADLEDFIADLLARRSAATAATRYKVLRVLYGWLEEEEEIPSPMAKMKPPIVPEQPVPVIPDDGLRRLLKVCEGKGFEARRDTALIMLLLDTGARRDELMNRKLTDLDLELDVLLVLGKGRRERTLPFGRKTALALDRYLRVRDRHKDAHLPWLWLGLRGQLTQWGLVMMLHRRGRQAGLPDLHPHQFRHTFAHQWLIFSRGRRRGGPDAPGRLEIPCHGATLRREHRRCPRPRGSPSPISRRPAVAPLLSAFLIVHGVIGLGGC
jgi:site-specific recombinase XerD